MLAGNSIINLYMNSILDAFLSFSKSGQVGVTDSRLLHFMIFMKNCPEKSRKVVAHEE